MLGCCVGHVAVCLCSSVGCVGVCLCCVVVLGMLESACIPLLRMLGMLCLLKEFCSSVSFSRKLYFKALMNANILSALQKQNQETQTHPSAEGILET